MPSFYLHLEVITPGDMEKTQGLYVTWAGREGCGPDYRIVNRLLPNYELVFVRKGTGTFQSAPASFAVPPRSVFALFPDVRHTYGTEPADPWEFTWVGFNGDHARYYLAQAGLTPQRPWLLCREPDVVWQWLQNIVSELTTRTLGYQLRALSYLALLLGTFTAEAGPADPFADPVTIVRDYLQAHYREPVSLEQLGGMVGLSRSHLCRLFRQATGTTIVQTLTDIRVAKAQALLLGMPQYSIAEIAQAVGFDDPYYFSRVFREHKGLCPRDYRGQYGRTKTPLDVPAC